MDEELWGIRPFSNIKINRAPLQFAGAVSQTGPGSYMSQYSRPAPVPSQLDVGREIEAIDPSSVGAANMPDQPSPDGGIGLQGTLGILNLGLGLGGQIAKMAMSKKPKKPPVQIGWGGNPFG